jgi:hypothetical protein
VPDAIDETRLFATREPRSREGIVQARFSVDPAGPLVNVATEGHKLLASAIVQSLEASHLDAEICGMREFTVAYHFEIDSVKRDATMVTSRGPNAFTVLSKNGSEIICMLWSESKPLSWWGRIWHALKEVARR